MYIDQTVGAIVLGPQYNLQEGCFSYPYNKKNLWQSYFNPVNMAEDTIERYNTFNTEVCQKETIFVYFSG